MPKFFRALVLAFACSASFFIAQTASAQGKPAVAVIELEVRNPEAFAKEFFPLAAKVFADAGGTFLVRPSQPTPVDGTAPKRVAVVRFESVEKAVATLASQAYRDARKIGDQYADFRIFVLELSAP